MVGRPSKKIFKQIRVNMINLENDKYTINITKEGRIEVLRYGEPWRDCTGDKLILALVHEIDSLRTKLFDMEDGQYNGWSRD